MSETLQVDAEARVRLPARFANRTVLLEEIDEYEFRISSVGSDLSEAYPAPLTAEDRDLFIEVGENPPEPNEALLRAMRRYRDANG